MATHTRIMPHMVRWCMCASSDSRHFVPTTPYEQRVMLAVFGKKEKKKKEKFRKKKKFAWCTFSVLRALSSWCCNKLYFLYFWLISRSHYQPLISFPCYVKFYTCTSSFLLAVLTWQRLRFFFFFLRERLFYSILSKNSYLSHNTMSSIAVSFFYLLGNDSVSSC